MTSIPTKKMSFCINRIKTPLASDNLLILANKNDLAWEKDYLTPSEKTYLAYAAKNNVNYVFFPKGTQGIIIHFIEIADSIDAQKETNRIAGNDIISAISHYKIEEITLVNKIKKKSGCRICRRDGIRCVPIYKIF